MAFVARRNLRASPQSKQRVNAAAVHRALVRTGIVAAILLALFASYVVTVNALRLRQVRNCADLQTITLTIEAFHEKTGRYPQSIAEAINASGMDAENRKHFSSGVDVWGNRYLYLQRDGDFVLVSYGRGGDPDGIDYWHQTVQQGGNACRQLSADIFANREGVVRCCGK
jgi:hypothetical protein